MSPSCRTADQRPSFYSNPEEVFDLPDIDAVVISTTTNTHAPLTIKAIEKGKVSVGRVGVTRSDAWV